MNLLKVAMLVAVLAGAAGGDADPGADWSLAGRIVFRVRASYGGMSPAQRVEEYDFRLNEILSKHDRPLGAADISLIHAKGAWAISVLGDLLVTVTAADAEANKTTIDKLGQVWLTNVRKTVPLVTPRVNRGGA